MFTKICVRDNQGYVCWFLENVKENFFIIFSFTMKNLTKKIIIKIN